MDIIKVNSSKMKIILTDTDFKQMGVDALSFDYTDEKSKDVLKKFCTNNVKVIPLPCKL